MRRTQLYLDDHLWDVLHARAHSRDTTISELVREAVREQYLGKADERKEAMLRFIGIRKNRPVNESAEEEVRRLRKGSRLKRLAQQ